MAEECGKCSTKIKDSESAVTCSGFCKLKHHSKCVELSVSEAQHVNNGKNIKWFCDKCLIFIDFGEQIQSEIEDLKKSVSKQFEDFKKTLKGNTSENNVTYEVKKSYANVASEVVVIKPKNAQESKKTKEEIQKKLQPATLEVGITEIKNIRDGGVIIKCKHKEEVEKIKAAAEKKLNKKYNIKIPDQKNPCIKIMDIEEEMNENDLKRSILKQNQYLHHDSSFLEVKIVKKMKTRYLSIIECDPLTFRKIMEQNRLSIGWSTCRVFEYVNVYRCYKCGGFDHKSSDCIEVRCLICGKNGHTKDGCEDNSVNCANCITANGKLNLKLKTDHSIFDMSCPCYLKKIETQKRKIKYDIKSE